MSADTDPAVWSLIDAHYNRRTIIAKSQCAHIIRALWSVGDGASFLVFGLGLDRPLWTEANAQGHTLFVEQDPKWIQSARDADPDLDIVWCIYDGWTVANSLPLSIERLEQVEAPAKVRAREWDVILVDAPWSFAPRATGRALPIYWARQYMADDGRVFVDDAERKLERTYCDYLFPEPEFHHEVLLREPDERLQMRSIRRAASAT